MNSERFARFVGHMYDAARQACYYIEGMSCDEFLADRKTQQAVVMNLMILGEASARMIESDPDLSARFPNVPWTSMKGMRNRIAHGYFELAWRWSGERWRASCLD